jgi:DNA mismatch repair ATPase MutS
VHGFYIEVTNAHVERIPDDYRRRQTLKNAERYITPELKAFEDRALSAAERATSREKYLYEQLLDALAPESCRHSATSPAPGQLDGLARLRARRTATTTAGRSSSTRRHRSCAAATRWSNARSTLHRQRLR